MSYLNVWKTGLIAVLTTALPLCAEAMQWPDTGQRNCYDNEKVIPCPADESSPFYGQDAQYEGTVRSYTKLGTGGVELPDSATEWIMVRDNVTGLIWELKDSMDGSTNYANLHDADNIYTWCKRSIGAGTCGDATNTEDFINAMNSETFGGYTDWRLPTVNELSTLIDHERLNVPHINAEYFKLSTQDCHWSSEKNFGLNNYAWISCLSVYIGEYLMSSVIPVRAVRGGN